MTFNILNRKIHYWASIAIALPLLLIIGSGLLLQVKKHWSWVQPTEHHGTGTVPLLSFKEILDSVKSVPELGVSGWPDINRLDIRPGRGVVKVWLQNGWEVQVDLGTGQVLHSAYRRSDLIESIHDGSFFAGEWTKSGLFFLAGIGLLLLWISGLWMFSRPLVLKHRRKSATTNKKSLF
jgi:hypothetical protein